MVFRTSECGVSSSGVVYSQRWSKHTAERFPLYDTHEFREEKFGRKDDPIDRSITTLWGFVGFFLHVAYGCRPPYHRLSCRSTMLLIHRGRQRHQTRGCRRQNCDSGKCSPDCWEKRRLLLLLLPLIRRRPGAKLVLLYKKPWRAVEPSTTLKRPK